MTGGDYGVIFLADNMAVTPAPTPPSIILSQAVKLANGAFQFGFTNSPGATFTVLGSTNPALPMANWTVLGTAAEISAGSYQFTDAQAVNRPAYFYRVSSP